MLLQHIVPEEMEALQVKLAHNKVEYNTNSLRYEKPYRAQYVMRHRSTSKRAMLPPSPLPPFMISLRHSWLGYVKTYHGSWSIRCGKL